MGVPEGPAAVDAQFWNLLSDADPIKSRKSASMDFTMKGMWATDIDLIGNAAGGGRGTVLQGVRFTTGGNGIQWENTGSAVMAMKHYQLHFADAEDPLLLSRMNAARDSLKHLLAVYGTIPASVLGGNIAAYLTNDHTSPYPGGSDTGIGWTYLRYPHAASTAWAGLLLMYQFDETDDVREDANPFAPPATTVPDPQIKTEGSRQCLPQQPPVPAWVPADGDRRVCSAYPGCLGRELSGDCCPTKEGMVLGCCYEDHAPPAPPPTSTKAVNQSDAVYRDAPAGQRASRPAACSASMGCARLGLEGVCCPTLEGTMLGCC